MLKESFKYYKRKCPPPSLEEVIDFSNKDTPKNHAPTSSEIRNNLGLKPSSEWKIFLLEEKPGFTFIPNPFTSIGQRYWIYRCLKHYTKKPSRLNLDAHGHDTDGDWWDKCQNNCEQSFQLTEKLRWATLGYHHNWDTKVLLLFLIQRKVFRPRNLDLQVSSQHWTCYFLHSEEFSLLLIGMSDSGAGPSGIKRLWKARQEKLLPEATEKEMEECSSDEEYEEIVFSESSDGESGEDGSDKGDQAEAGMVYKESDHDPFPEDLAALSQQVAQVLGFPKFSAEAAIINYYHMDSTLSCHTDHSELNLDAPLLSFSFGQSAVFLLGSKSKEDRPLAIKVDSGDIVIMSGESRHYYHGVPLILPAKICSWHAEEKECRQPLSKEESPRFLDSMYVELVNDELWKPFEKYISTSRINMNVRQVLPFGQSSL